MNVLDVICSAGIVPVIEIDRVEDAAPLAEALLAGGLGCVEITCRTDAAERAIESIVSRYPEMLVAAGTVLRVEQAEAAVAAGGRLIVAPGFDREVVDWCRAHATAIVPGAVTPTEIGLAGRSGLDVVKFFPAEVAGGVDALKAIAPAFPNIGFMPTGGIGPANLAAYLSLPAVVACGGSWLATRQLIADRDFGEIRARTAAAVSIVGEVRGLS